MTVDQLANLIVFATALVLFLLYLLLIWVLLIRPARRCPAGGKHRIIRKRTMVDCWDECEKCGRMGGML